MASAAPAAVHRQPNRVVVVDSGELAVLYGGHLITPTRLVELNREHRAVFHAGDVASAERGYAHAFDLMAELDAYSRQLVRPTAGRPPPRTPGSPTGGGWPRRVGTRAADWRRAGPAATPRG